MRLEIARGRDNAPLMLDGQFVGPGMKDLFGLGVLEPAALAFALDLRPILRVIRDQPLAHGLKLRVGGHDGRIGTKYGRDIISSVGQLVYLLPVAAAFFHDLSPCFNHVGLASVLAGDLLGFFYFVSC